MSIITEEKNDKSILNLYENADNEWRITYTDEEENPYDLTGATIKATLKRSVDDTNSIDADITLLDQQTNKGQFDIKISYTKSGQIYNTLKTTEPIADVRIILQSGEVIPAFRIQFKLYRSTTAI